MKQSEMLRLTCGIMTALIEFASGDGITLDEVRQFMLKRYPGVDAGQLESCLATAWKQHTSQECDRAMADLLNRALIVHARDDKDCLATVLPRIGMERWLETIKELLRQGGYSPEEIMASTEAYRRYLTKVVRQ